LQAIIHIQHVTRVAHKLSKTVITVSEFLQLFWRQVFFDGVVTFLSYLGDFETHVRETLKHCFSTVVLIVAFLQHIANYFVKVEEILFKGLHLAHSRPTKASDGTYPSLPEPPI